MANRSLKVTGFTRFLLVMLIVAPMAYFGAIYFNEKDGVQYLRNVFQKGEKKEIAEPIEEAGGETKPLNQSPSAKALEEENRKLKEALEFKTKRVDELYLENEQLKRKLESLENTLEATKK